MPNQKEIIHEFIYKYIVELHNERRTLLMDIDKGLKDINYNMYMYLIGDNVTANERLRREQYFIELYQTPNFVGNFTYEEPKYIAKIQSSQCMIYLYRGDNGSIRAGDDKNHFNEKYKKFHLTKEEIARTDKQFLSFMKPVGGYWWQKEVED